MAARDEFCVRRMSLTISCTGARASVALIMLTNRTAFTPLESALLIDSVKSMGDPLLFKELHTALNPTLLCWSELE